MAAQSVCVLLTFRTEDRGARHIDRKWVYGADIGRHDIAGRFLYLPTRLAVIGTDYTVEINKRPAFALGFDPDRLAVSAIHVVTAWESVPEVRWNRTSDRPKLHIGRPSRKFTDPWPPVDRGRRRSALGVVVDPARVSLASVEARSDGGADCVEPVFGYVAICLDRIEQALLDSRAIEKAGA